MGRVSLATQRKGEILDALERCVQKFGLANSSMARVALEAGVQRTLISHYFGTREVLLGALFDRLLDARTREFEQFVAKHPNRSRLDAGLNFLFGGPFVGMDDGLTGTGETFSLAARNEDYRARLQKMYEGFALVIEAELVRAFPDATPVRRREVAYAVMCLAEQNQALSWLGFAPVHHRYALRSARALMEGLA